MGEKILLDSTCVRPKVGGRLFLSWVSWFHNMDEDEAVAVFHEPHVVAYSSGGESANCVLVDFE